MGSGLGRCACAVGLCLIAATGCSAETSVFVTIDAQDLGRARASGVRLRVLGPDGEVELADGDLSIGPDGGHRLPIVLRLTPAEGRAERRWALIAELTRADGAVVGQQALVGGFIDGERRYALLCFEDECLGRRCGAGASCDPTEPEGAGCDGCTHGECGRVEAELLAEGGNLRCPPVAPRPEADCENGADDDADGLIDCADSDCAGLRCSEVGEACIAGDCTCQRASSETRCAGGVDEDCDSAVDCDDDDCRGRPCEDGDLCTGGETCTAGGACVGIGLDCDDGIACTTDACDPEVGCTHAPDPSACDDANPCTEDRCVAGEGCVHTPREGSCDDSDACTRAEACVDGVCVAEPLDCDDANPCTDDSCDPASGCVHEPHAGGCDDADACTSGDSCVDGACVGAAISCSDGNPCTDDVCDPTTGCANPPNAAGCDDGDACTSGDRCVGGRCSGDAVSCSDSNPCTSDVCDPARGCTFPANTASCNDGNACTINDRCAGGRCSGEAVICNDGNPCTVGRCDATGACVHDLRPNGSSCGMDRVCCGGLCRWMGSESHCGGCFQSCRDGMRCLEASNQYHAGFHCNCNQNAPACPNGQDCRRPTMEAYRRCMCDDDSECRYGTCVRSGGEYNLCRYD